MANIAIDSIALQGAMGKGRGIGNYTKNQLLKMFEKDQGNQYFYLDFYGDFQLENEIKAFDNVHYEYYFCGRNSEIIREQDFVDVYGGVIKGFIKKNNIDVFYITSPFDPTVSIYEKEWFENVTVIATVYDVIPYVMRDYYFKYLDSKWYLKVVDFLKTVDHILVISDSVKKDLIEYLEFNPDMITVIYGAPGGQFRKISVDDDEKKAICDKYSINGEFLLCTGGDDYRKNIDGLIKAYAKVDGKIREKYQLVVVCKLSDESEKRYRDLCVKEGIVDRVVFTNFVSDDELVELYNIASLLVFPSKYEGFGLPIVEAWACGTGVVSSNNSSLCEIVGDAGVLVDPNDINSIADGINNAVPKRGELARGGEERLKNYTWDLVAQTTIDTINNIQHKTKMIDTEKVRIAMFTPMPPQRSGIADYSADICSELSNYYEIDVFVEDASKVDINLHKSINIYSHFEFEMRAGEKAYSRIIYQMGNSNYHFYMYNYIFQYPGIIVLHDYNLNGAFIEYSHSKCGRFQKRLYTKIASCDYDKKYIKEIVSNNQTQSNLYDVELNGWLMQYAESVIVHSEYAQRKLLKRNPALLVNKIPLYASKDKKLLKRDKKNKDEILVGIFGFVHPIKRPEQIMRAISLLKKQQKNVKLVLVGFIDATYKENLDKLAGKLNITDFIEYTGYTDIEQFEEYLEKVDICLNLRYPNNGESSASFTRMLAAGKCAIVNDVGSFSEYPDDVCIKIPPVEDMSEVEEVLSIYNALLRLIENGEVVEQMGDNAREYAETVLNINRIGTMYKRVIDETPRKAILTKEIIDMVKKRFIDGEKYTADEIVSMAVSLSLAKGTLDN